MEEFINQTLKEMQEREDKKMSNIIGLIMRKCGVSHLIVDEEELVLNPENEILQIHDPIKHCIKLKLKGE